MNTNFGLVLYKRTSFFIANGLNSQTNYTYSILAFVLKAGQYMCNYHWWNCPEATWFSSVCVMDVDVAATDFAVVECLLQVIIVDNGSMHISSVKKF